MCWPDTRRQLGGNLLLPGEKEDAALKAESKFLEGLTALIDTMVTPPLHVTKVLSAPAPALAAGEQQLKH